MKVLHVIPSVASHAGGPSQAIIPMCASLMAQGIDVVLATTDDGKVSASEFRVSSSQSEVNEPHLTPNSKLETRNYYRGVPTVFFPSQLGASFKYSRPFALWLDEHVSDFDLVHIHAVFNHSSIAAARACRKHMVPYIVRPLGTLDPWSLQQKSWRKKLFWYGGIKTMLTRAAAVHYTTRGEQNAVETSLGLNHGAVVPLGIDMTTLGATSSPDEKTIADRFPELSDCPYVLVLSRLHPVKALEVLLAAFFSVSKRSELSEWRLVLAGDGAADYVASLKRLVVENNATGSVLFSGWLDGAQKETVLNKASLLALPSHHENFGLCVMEAMACGVPVLLSPQVNLAPEVEAAGAGWIAAVNIDSLAHALTEALSSDEERKRRGSAGRILAKRFSWPSVATKLTDLYQSVLQPTTASTIAV